MLTQLIGKMLEKAHQTLCLTKLVRLLRPTAVHSSRSKPNRILSKTYAKERYKINMCCWNARTLLDLPSSKHPERRTALVSIELVRLNIDIAAMSETRLAEEDELIEKGSEFSIFWVGKTKSEKSEGGVGFAIKSDLVENLERPAGITDCTMELRVPLPCGRFLSVLSVYDPTLEAIEEVNLAFYGALREAITKISVEEKLIILGDFNARVGKDWETWNSLGRHGIGKINSNGLRLLELCSELKLVICNTFLIPGFIRDQDKAI